MISDIIRTGLKAAATRSSVLQVQSKRTLYPRTKAVIVRRKDSNELGIVEKVSYYLIFVAIMYSYPFWAMAHFDDYRKGVKTW